MCVCVCACLPNFSAWSVFLGEVYLDCIQKIFSSRPVAIPRFTNPFFSTHSRGKIRRIPSFSKHISAIGTRKRLVEDLKSNC